MSSTIIQQARAILAAGATDPSLSKADTLAALTTLLSVQQRDDGGQAFPDSVAVGPAGDVYGSTEGMTLRDYFAARAPIEIPVWFRVDIGDCPAMPVSNLTREQYDEWNETGIYVDSAPALVEWDAIYSAARTAQNEWNQRYQIKLYFAWRLYYADMMVAERAL